LDEAERAGGKFPIPSTIQISDEQMGGFINISSDCTGLIPSSQGPAAAVGKSVTQIPDEYIFQYQNTKIVIIDTPGLLDTKDVGKDTHDTDKKHVNNILRLLSSYDEIHAICILLKANETRIRDDFTYVITEILKNLDKSAINNVIFFLTNAVSTRFKPEKTQPILEKFLTENKLAIPLPPTKSTVYCFESDPVEYLLKRKNEIPLEEDEKEDTTKNWKRSKDSTAKAISYVCSLDPLPLDGINAIYDAQCTIGTLSKLVMETLQCVADNVKELESKKEEAEQKKAEIRMNPTKSQQFSIDTVTSVEIRRIVRTELGYTNVVCGTPKCVSFVDGEPAYTQICCKKCKHMLMFFCGSMDWAQNCKVCSCAKHEHEWARTESKVITEIVPLIEVKTDTAAEAEQAAQDVDTVSKLENINRAIYECEYRVKTYKSETECMLRTCAKLNTYVTQNALMPSSDVDEMTRILKNRIAAYVTQKAGKELSDFTQILKQYNQYLGEETSNRYTPFDVHKLIQELYKLPMNGHDLKEAMEVEERARLKFREAGRKASPMMVLAGFCGKFISKIKPASWLYRRFENMTCDLHAATCTF